MMYNAANCQQSNTYQYPTDKKGRETFELPKYYQAITKLPIFLTNT